MKIAVGFDRRGGRLRGSLIGELLSQGHEVLDLGVSPADAAVDYARKALEIADAVLSGRVERAVLVSSSAVGASFVANKVDGIHAGVCADTYTAERGVELGMNVVCLGVELTAAEAAAIVRAFLGATVRVPHAIETPRRRQAATAGAMVAA
jgi:ribose 5-phosphate isomerase B